MKIKSVVKIGFLFVVLLMTSIGYAVAQQDTSPEQEVERLKKRVTELESQILSMQVIIGSLESLVKQQKAASQVVGQFNTQSSTDTESASSSDNGSDSDSILETKVQALTAQVEQLTRQVQGLSSGGAVQDGNNIASANQQDSSFNQSGASQASGFQSNNGAGGNAALAYDEAYGHLLRRDFPAAEKAFVAFLGKYKNDTLAGNAQYWLGEAYYQQANFKKAADSFLKSYSKYRQGPKAPDSLLKLAMSLNQLGQNKAACSTFSELKKSFPQAPKHVSDRANKLSSRLGC